eukprot:m.342005 g.342005  ORF g.342005 m.342005 type:complete len:81 (+) comp20785_c0_seq1:227-469(+)
MDSEKKTEQNATTSEKDKEQDEDEEDPMDQRIARSGCAEFHYKLQDCYTEKRDWRECQLEMKEFKECNTRQLKLRSSKQS